MPISCSVQRLQKRGGNCVDHMVSYVWLPMYCPYQNFSIRVIYACVHLGVNQSHLERGE